MKTAVSIPDHVYEDAERVAKRLKKSRSQVYAEAVAEYVAKHDPENATEAMNRVCDGVADLPDPVVSEAARRTLERSDW